MINSLDLVVLGALKEKPQYAGEILTNLKNKNIHRILKISLTSIYKKVVILEKEGYIKGEDRAREKGQDIRIYTITDEGNKYFDEVMSGRIKAHKVEVAVNINDIIINIEFIEKDKRLKYIEMIKKNILEAKQKLYKDKTLKSYADKLIFTQQEKVLNALEEWIIEVEDEILMDS